MKNETGFQSFANSFQAVTVPGLSRIAALCKKLGEPQKGIKFLHIAGTNGKGSTAACLTEILTAAGFKVGKDIEIKFTGLRPGEKLYEEVLANSENTIETEHKKIRIAKVRQYDYNEAIEHINKLTELAYSVKIWDMVKLMKSVVPEFKSKNSRFEELDN